MFDDVAKGFAGGIFTVYQYHAGAGRGDGVEPFQQFRLPGVGAEPAEFMDLCLNGDPFAIDPDGWRTFNKLAAKGSRSLVADDQHGCFGFPEIVPQMVLDPSGVAHAGTGNDHARSFYLVELL